MENNQQQVFGSKLINNKLILIGDKTLNAYNSVRKSLITIGDVTQFIGRIISETFSREFEFKEFARQCYKMGVSSLPLISLTGGIMGLVLTIQSRPILVEFGAVSLLPGMVAVSLIREMGPVITALICAGKIGSGIGAEIASMRVTEQIDAMEVSATNPMRYLVATRVLAATVVIPILVLYANVFGLWGSWIGTNIKGDVSFTLYFSQAFSIVEFIDFLPATIKTVFFGAAIGIVGCYKGYNAKQGTESVGITANSSVVVASLFVIVLDMIAVQITDILISEM